MGPKPTADKKVKKCLNLFDHGGLVGLGGLGERRKRNSFTKSWKSRGEIENFLKNLENQEEK